MTQGDELYGHVMDDIKEDHAKEQREAAQRKESTISIQSGRALPTPAPPTRSAFVRKKASLRDVESKLKRYIEAKLDTSRSRGTGGEQQARVAPMLPAPAKRKVSHGYEHDDHAEDHRLAQRASDLLRQYL